MSSKLHLLAAAAGLAALVGTSAARAAEPQPAPDDRVIPAGSEVAAAPAQLVKHIGTGTHTIIQNKNPFHIEIPDLSKDASGVSEILLEVYDPNGAPGGRWKGYGLMDVKTERLGVSELRSLSASIDFLAPGDGIYSLRTRARDRAGNLEQKPNDLSDVRWIVVLDREAPKVRIHMPQTDGKPLEPGSRLKVTWEVKDSFAADMKAGSNVTAEISRDGGKTWRPLAEPEATVGDGSLEWKVEGPDTESLIVRVSIKDEAGNQTVAMLDKPLAVKTPPPPPPPPPPPLPSVEPVKPVEPVETVEQPVKPVEPPQTELPVAADTNPGSGATAKPIAVPPPAIDRNKALQAYQTGVIYMNRGDLERAAKFFEEAIRLDAGLAPAFVDLTATYLRLYDREPPIGAGYLDRAVRAAGDGLKYLPREVALYYNQAQARYRQGRLDDAAASLDAGLAVEPRHLESLYALALIRSTQKRTGDAAVLWKQVAAIGGMSDRAVEKRLAREAVRCLAELDRVEAKRSAAVAPRNATQ